MPSFTFSATLKNQVSSEAKNIQRDTIAATIALGNLGSAGVKASRMLENSFKNTASQAQTLGAKIHYSAKEIDGMNRSSNSLNATLHNMNNWLSVLRTGYNLLSGAIDQTIGRLVRFGNSSLEAFSSRESQVTAYTQLLRGDRGEAENTYGKALKMGQLTNLTSAQTLDMQSQLMIGGLRGKELEKMTAGGLDLATAAPDEERTTRMHGYTRAIRQILTKGYLSNEELTKQLGDAGLNVGMVKEAIGAGRGIKGNRADVSQAVDKLIRDKQIGAVGENSEAMRAIRIGLSNQFNQGGKLGTFATSQAGSIKALESNRLEAFENIQKSYNAEMLPSVRAYKDALTKSTANLDVNTKTGNNFRTVLADLANTGIGMKTAWESFTTGFFESFSTSYTNALKEMGINSGDLGTKMSEIGSAAKSLGEWFGKLGSMTASLIHAFDDVGLFFKYFMDSMGKYLKGDIKGGLEAEATYRVIKAARGTKEVQSLSANEMEEFKRTGKMPPSGEVSRANSINDYTNFGTTDGVTKGGGTFDASDRERGNIPKVEPARRAAKQGRGRGSGDGDGASHGGTSSGSTTISGGGIKIGTMHLEMHLHGSSWDEVKHIIEQEGPSQVKQLFERIATEMAV